MPYEQKPGYGALFHNDKPKGENPPLYKGTIAAHRDIKAGEQLELAAWLRESQSKLKYLSLKMSDPYKAAPQTAPQREPGADDPDDSIPW